MIFEYVNVLADFKKEVEISTMFNTSIYVDEKLFFNDMGFKNEESIVKQFNVDAPRCIFKYNRIQYNRYCKAMSEVPYHDLAYCTQAVLGLPVCLLFFNMGEVFESGFPMIVNVKIDGTVIVTKQLRSKIGSELKKILIRVTKYNDYVQIDFKVKDICENS